MQRRAVARRAGPAALLAMLCACSQDSGTAVQTYEVPASGTASIIAPAPSGTAPADAPTTGSSAGIPERLRGRWGMTRADCDPSTGADKGSLVVSERTLRFFEATGALATVDSRSDEAIDATFAFSGEGQTWTRRQTLTLGPDGKLVRREGKGGDASGSFVYGRCRPVQ